MSLKLFLFPPSNILVNSLDSNGKYARALETAQFHTPPLKNHNPYTKNCLDTPCNSSQLYHLPLPRY